MWLTVKKHSFAHQIGNGWYSGSICCHDKHPDQKQLRRRKVFTSAGTQAETRSRNHERRLLSGSYTYLSLASFHMQPRSPGQGTALPTGGWTLPCQLAGKITTHYMPIYQYNLGSSLIWTSLLNDSRLSNLPFKLRRMERGRSREFITLSCEWSRKRCR